MATTVGKSLKMRKTANNVISKKLQIRNQKQDLDVRLLLSGYENLL